MDLLQTSIGHSEYHYQVNLPQKPTKEREFLPPKAKNPQIKKCIQKLAQKRLFGHPYVKRYLYDQYRRGCRPNTIRTNFGAIILFIAHLKSLGSRELSGHSNGVYSKVVSLTMVTIAARTCPSF